MKHLYFVRHAVSEMNEAGRWAGMHSMSPLTPEGHVQARQAGQHAQTLKIDHIVSSPLERAHHTARIIAKEIGYPEHKIELNSLLVERDFGALEGKPWSPDLDVDGFADVETVDSLHERAHLIYQLLLTLPDDNILIVSHGAIGRALRHIIHTLHPDVTSFSDTQFPHAEIIQLL